MRTALSCQICHQPLTNGLDTYGAYGEERCFNCHFRIGDCGFLVNSWGEIITGEEMLYWAKWDYANAQIGHGTSGIEKATKDLNIVQREVKRAHRAYENTLWWIEFWRCLMCRA